MIKRLRKNIICVNMLLVGIVILAIFGVVCFNSYQTAYSSLEHGMTDVLKKGNRMDDEAPISEKIGKRDFKGEMPMQLSSYVIVELNDDNSVKSKTENNLSIDSEILEKCISYVTSHHEHNGQLNEYSLMYAHDDFQEETKIIFTENSSVYNAFFNTLIISALLFLASMVVIALISLWLSGFAVKPVIHSHGFQAVLHDGAVFLIFTFAAFINASQLILHRSYFYIGGYAAGNDNRVGSMIEIGFLFQIGFSFPNRLVHDLSLYLAYRVPMDTGKLLYSFDRHFLL